VCVVKFIDVRLVDGFEGKSAETPEVRLYRLVNYRPHDLIWFSEAKQPCSGRVLNGSRFHNRPFFTQPAHPRLMLRMCPVHEWRIKKESPRWLTCGNLTASILSSIYRVYVYYVYVCPVYRLVIARNRWAAG
jgi:hypothetical protein